ncbi:MAG: DNA mismatch repair protein MutS [Nitrospiraceae bacterium]
MSETDASPLMRQYREIKAAHRDSILFFRVGDFYEMFDRDAEEASRILSIALTSRDKTSANPIPLCGVPYHAATGYIAKLLKAGRTVALCEQVEDPKAAKGLVRRDVVRVYTPGTLIDADLLPASESAWLAALYADMSAPASGARFGLAALDLSTGAFTACHFDGALAPAQLADELQRLEPKELLVPTDLPSTVHSLVQTLPRCRTTTQDTHRFDRAQAHSVLQKHYAAQALEAICDPSADAACRAAGAVLLYLKDTQATTDLRHLQPIVVRRISDTMQLDGMTIRNLELVRPFHDTGATERGGPSTLLDVLDATVTVMGGRLLREWIVRPLIDRTQILARLDAVDELRQRLALRTQLRDALGAVQDVARLSSRIAVGRASPRDLLALHRSLSALPAVGATLAQLDAALLKDLAARFDGGDDLVATIAAAIHPDAPVLARDGGVIRDGFHAEVDTLRGAMRDGKQWLVQLETKERTRTGIDSLKVRYNQVFGYYLEVTKTHLAKIPADYVRKQTLANAERFMTGELKELEEKITGAEGKLLALELQLFETLLRALATHTVRLQRIADLLATIDVLASLADTAARFRYVRPELVDDGSLVIVDGRHPVVERLVADWSFIPNDTTLDTTDRRVVILTGPNMAGKSTYLRQVALIVLMAQIGSFVPAKRAQIGLVDRVFTRVGASDNLAAGQSTFMVEMTEAAHILRHATGQSLILLDEIGRGTSTYDGLSLAWAITEYIHQPDLVGARTLFATHYHEMTELADRLPGVRNCRVAVKERDGDVLFLRKIVEGGADRSYGIHVAKLAGLPARVIGRAQEVLRSLEESDGSRDSRSPAVPTHSTSKQVSFLDPPQPVEHPFLEEVRQLDLFSMTPLDALNYLAAAKRRLSEST